MTEAKPDQGPRGGVTPHLTIPSRGAAAAIEFYARAFGAEALDALRGLPASGQREALAEAVDFCIARVN